MVLPHERRCHKPSPKGNLEWCASRGCIPISSRRAVFSVIGQGLELESQRTARGGSRGKALGRAKLAEPDRECGQA